MRGTAENGQYRPLLLVSITIGAGSQDVWMLVDSGADYTTIPTSLAEAISGTPGDKLGKPTGNAIGVGGEVPQRVVEAELSYLNRVFARQIFVSAIPRPVLGRNDFMATFDLQFQWGSIPPEFHVALNARFATRKNLAIRPRRKA